MPNSYFSTVLIIANTYVWLKRIHVSILQRGHVQWRSKPIGYVQPYLNTSGKLAHQICKSPNIAFLSAVGVISHHRLRGGLFLFFSEEYVSCCFYWKEAPFLSVNTWTILQQRSGAIMHNETPAPPFLHLHRSWSLRVYIF